MVAAPSQVKQHQTQQSITPGSMLQAFLDGGGRYNGLHFWDNFEIGSLAFWRRDDVQAFISHIDASHGIFYHRWGDAEIHTLAVALFMPGEQLWFADFPYQHYHYYHCPQEPAATRRTCQENARSISYTMSPGGRKPAGSVEMNPAESFGVSQKFMKIAYGKWGWPRTGLHVPVR
ncbi:hypothetical protein CYMTET_43518 [Cymbomonas tetramitiformis]|uniref:Uncharacterized protein n=1 Tax=Cymbomonas tetramitiformis TaxID=36881 RepID=A0AAE0F0J4_9CHLO|nr:hypothetical protein CYMTET_43518 [Cymbomonas tetramitiformis]